MVSFVLKKPVPDEDGQPFGVQILSEKNPPADSGKPVGSFSRVAGAIGSTVLAALFAGISYWALHTLFMGGDLTRLQDLSTFFLVGSALFAPYAFNQIRGIFQ